jgi:hypothetical protein
VACGLTGRQDRAPAGARRERHLFGGAFDLGDRCARPDQVAFAADYPFDATEQAPHFIDSVALADEVRDDICFNNAARFLELKGG